jgi:hypothetical protein
MAQRLLRRRRMQQLHEHEQRPFVQARAWKAALADVHEGLRLELIRLESTAWREARRLPPDETAQMMRTLQTLRVETLRHLGVADRLPAAGDADEAWRAHIGDQWTVEKAMEKAFLASRGKVTSSLQRLQGGLCRLFEVERACAPHSGPSA